MFFNSRDPFFKNPFGAVEEGLSVTFILHGSPGDKCPSLCIKKDGGTEQRIKMEIMGDRIGVFFSCTYDFLEAGLYFYRFETRDGPLYNTGKGIAGTSDTRQWFVQTVYARGFTTPDWLKGGVFYQIFPDRFFEGKRKEILAFPDRVYRRDKDGLPFYKSGSGDKEKINTDYFGGDFSGIEKNLYYLARFGVKGIYLNPIFLAHSNHRYNTADYTKPDPDLGTMDDFKRLCRKADEYGMKIILDGVFSHTGSDSIYFNREGRYGNGGAYNDPESPYRSWYDFDAKYKNGYRAWWDFDTLPEVNESSESYIDFICGEGGIIDLWLSRGAGGLRLDVADELPDEFIQKIRRAVKRNGRDKLLIGEVWEDAVTKISYSNRRKYLLGKGLDGVMNYPFRSAILDFIKYGNGDKFCQSVFEIYENYPPQALDVSWNLLSTHDTPRALTVLSHSYKEGLDRKEQSKEKISDFEYGRASMDLVCAYALAFALPGVPCIYYGDEAGMQGYADPFNRKYFGLRTEDEYISENLEFISEFRTNNPVYAEGGLCFVYVSFDCVGFVRYNRSGEALTIVNRGDIPVKFHYRGKDFRVPPHSYHNERIR